jgi:hypothetical protein
MPLQNAEPVVTKSENLMALTWTRAAKVRRAFKAGRTRQKDLVLTPLRAILEASIFMDGLRAAMREAGLSDEDVRVGLVLMDEDNDWIYVSPIPRELDGLPKMYGKIKKLEGSWRPLGIVCGQRDRETETHGGPEAWTAWGQQWLTDMRSVKALLFARDAAGIKGGEGLHKIN